LSFCLSVFSVCVTESLSQSIRSVTVLLFVRCVYLSFRCICLFIHMSFCLVSSVRFLVCFASFTSVCLNSFLLVSLFECYCLVSSSLFLLSISVTSLTILCLLYSPKVR
jgi:hypothetical protein